MSKITDFFKQITSDLKDESVGQTPEEKNSYRWKIVGLMVALAVVAGFIFPLAAIIPLGIAVWKVKIIMTDKS